MGWDILIVIGIVWIIMSVLSFVQNVLIKNIQNALRPLGKLYYGKNAGFMRTSLLIFVALDESGKVLEANKLKTARILIPPKVMPFPQINGRNITQLSTDDNEFDKNTMLALNDLFVRYQEAQKNNGHTGKGTR